MLEKTYLPAEIEPRIAKTWDDGQAFKAGRPERATAEPYCIVIPPPNVTGSLHMGHALNITLQDILCRFERMRGKDVLWQPGTDHAGIATQLVVERRLAERQLSRRALGREKFLEEVWQWKAESGGTISNQLRRLGASCDWSRERFTMDEGLSQAVLKVFVALHAEGLIYKDKRLVNWDPEFQSAVSDLEVDSIEVKGHLWHLRYPLQGKTFNVDDPSTFIVVATTRPETMLGDTAIAVNPDDPRYQALIGSFALLPLVGRAIKIVGDAYSDPTKGSGAVKITPAHDFNDYEVGKRHALEVINILNPDATLNESVPKAYRLMDRMVARKQVVADLDALGLLAKVEPHTHAVPHSQRGGAVIEPYLTDQWYADAATLAKPALEAVRTGQTRFVPEKYAADYFRWLENIQPWCISRQLWWGHQIPAWYGPDRTIFVALDEAGAKAQAKKHYGRDEPITRDPDVLDTWFSSALWPFSTLGWPDATPEIKRFYPTSALVTGFDIIFFWVARMMMTGVHFLKEVPFKDVYIHALVRDEQGQKMSKTKGNVMDPLDIIDGIGLDGLVTKRIGGLSKQDANRVEKLTRGNYPDGVKGYGTDALRFTLAAQAAQGRDVKLALPRVEGYRNFATKLWNAARFAEMNECVRQRDFRPDRVQETLNQWIAGETERAAAAVTSAILAYKFNEAANACYEFIWGTFCDWYLELAKPIFSGSDEAAKAETRATTAWVLDQILKLLHPFMPFITEELWGRMVEVGEQRQALLCLSQWPDFKDLAKPSADAEINWLVAMISDVRSVRSEMNVPASAKIPLVLVGATPETNARVQRHEDTILRMTRADAIRFEATSPKGSAQIVVGETTVCLPLGGIIDMSAEQSRLEKAIAAADSDSAKMSAKLDNPNFMQRASPDAIEDAQERMAELTAQRSKLAAALKRLAGG